MSMEGNKETAEELDNLDPPTGILSLSFPTCAMWVMLPMRVGEE